MNGQPTLFVDQYGNIFWAKPVKDLRSKVTGRVAKIMHKPDGEFGLFIERFNSENPESASSRLSESANVAAG
jgi:hypothetical protein